MSNTFLYSPQQANQMIAGGTAIAVDVRDPEDYAKAHILGAANIPEMFYELSMSTEQGVKEMAEKFIPLFSNNGLSKDKTIILYEDSLNTRYGGSCRGYSQLTFFGHPNVSILDGGLAAWTKESLPLTSGDELLTTTDYVPVMNESIFASKAEMISTPNDPTIKILDNRDADEWRGERSPPYGIDFAPRKGRLPGARWIEWYHFMEDRGGVPYFKTAEKIRSLCAQAGLYPHDDIIVDCFKGARASNTYIALKIAGFENVRNYYGSWSEWSRDHSLPIHAELLVA